MPIRFNIPFLFLLAALGVSQTSARVPETQPAEAAGNPPAQVAKDLDKQCSARVAEACGSIGFLHLLGAHGRTQDDALAAKYLQLACDIGPPSECSAVADLYRRGRGVPVDLVRAIALHTKACDAGNRSGCFGLLSMQSEGLMPAANQASNLQVLEKVCRPDPKSWYCTDGTKLVNKIQVPAAVYQAQQCDAGEPYECMALANAHADGKGVPLNMTRAAVFYGKACDLGLGVACNLLGEFYVYGTGVGQDYARAVQRFEQGCTGKVVEGCANLGTMYFNGTGVPQDLNRAAALNQKACDGGVARGCSFMERAGIAILGTPEQRKAEANALERESKRESAATLQRAYEVNVGDLANHFKREARTRADADAMLADIGRQAPANSPQLPRASTQPSSKNAAPTPRPESSASAPGKPLRFILRISMRNKPGDTVNPTCYSNVITRDGPPGWGAPGFLPPGSGQQATQLIENLKGQFIALCSASGREITSAGNFNWQWNQRQYDEQQLAGAKARYREDVTVSLD